MRVFGEGEGFCETPRADFGSAGSVFVLSAQCPRALSTSRFLFPCTVTICSTSQSICRTRVRGPERGFVQSMWCHLVWVLSDVPGRALAAGSLQQCCAASLQLPAVGVWSTACWPGHTELLAACREGDCGHTACPHQTRAHGIWQEEEGQCWNMECPCCAFSGSFSPSANSALGCFQSICCQSLSAPIQRHFFLQQSAAKQMKEQEVSWKTLKPHFAMFNLGLEQP